MTGLQFQVQIPFCGTGLESNHQEIGYPHNGHVTQADTSWLAANLQFLCVGIDDEHVTEEMTSLVPLEGTTND